VTHEVWRVSGAGNDFLALADPETAPAPGAVREWCRRGASLGADGLFVLRSGDPVVMEYWNADGSPAGLCLNGARCAAQLAFELGWAGSEMPLATGAGVLQARRLDARSVELEVPILPRDGCDLEVAMEASAVPACAIRVGVPHLVVPWARDLSACPVQILGPALRRDPRLGVEGANVHFVRWPDARTLEIRSFERGVEAETLACGTGVLAAVAVGLARHDLRLPVTARTRGGFDLRVSGTATGGAVREWRLAGDARVLAKERVRPEARNLPEPRWSQGSRA
jgi:diaminopimelate epimerase